MSLLNIAYSPAPQVHPNDTVRDAVATALPDGCDAVVVVEDEKIAGILTSRDVMLKVVLRRLDSESTLVRHVMTSPVVSMHPETDPAEALGLMLEHHIRHIPLSEDGRILCGLVSLRRVLNYIVEDQRDNLLHMESFLRADSPGG